MSVFVLVVNDVSTTNFEKAIEVQIRSAGKIKFIPQGYGQPGSQGANGVANGPMQAHPQSGLLSNVRFEWDQSGFEFGSDIVKALAGHHRQHEPVPNEVSESAGMAAAQVV